MEAAESHRHGVLCFEAKDYAGALVHFRRALAQAEFADLWSDWAATQFALSHPEEAEIGFLLALEIEPRHVEAACNLAALLLQQGRCREATPWLELAMREASSERRFALQSLASGCAEAATSEHCAEWERFLRSSVQSNKNELSYFETHLQRYLATLSLLPDGGGSLRLLELGAAFHHLTPALLRCKHYAEVRCNDVWEGPRQAVRSLVAADGACFEITVDNFDVQSAPWPYADSSFDSVLCCEMLEHLHTDPMGLFAEINRILRPGGTLLLTTPNLASSHALEYALRGESPYVYGKFEPGGRSTDRHNREYTASEAAQLAVAGGFRVLTLQTRDSWWPRNRGVLRLLAAHGHPIALRGDNTFLLGAKESPVRSRFPEEFYQRTGTQANRRALQSGHNAQGQENSEPLNVLVVHEVLPHFDRSGSDQRLMDVLRELRAQGHAVTFLARDGRDRETYTRPLAELGIQVICDDPDRLRHIGRDEKTEWSLREALQSGSFDLAILCQWFWSGISIPEHYLDEIRRWSPSTRIAVLTDDRHGERERRAAVLSGLLSDLERGNDFEAREIEAYRRADFVLYIAESDRAHFEKLVPGLEMQFLPMVATVAGAGPDFTSREGALFLANFENLANRDALDWLLQQIWPLVHRRNPRLQLYIAGNATPEDVATSGTGIIRLGHLSDLREAFAARLVFAAPIRFGTGINTKNLRALAEGLPVVTTPVGAEGLQLQHEEHALIASDAESFAAHILRLASDADTWNRLALAGRGFVAARFSPEALSAAIRNLAARTRQISPKPAGALAWSYREIEEAIPDVLQAPARGRLLLRTLGYWQLGRKALDAGEPEAALRQFRHVFTAVRGRLPVSVLHTALLDDMARAYRDLGNPQMAGCCEAEKRLCVWSWPTKPPARPSRAKSGKDSGPVEISVVVPTYNRSHILRMCLAALAFQSLDADRWEIVIVDDGSTDDTPSMLREFLLPCRMRQVRQQNQGAGAARRSGVSAARGEFLLFCNDDTIASSNLLAEHLAFHRSRPGESWAVLGDFRYSEQTAASALCFFVNFSTFFFPQRALKAGQVCDQAYFVTCNLSVSRRAVLAAGNFDPAFRVAEDTELGTRLAQRGVRVVYHPAAVSWHEHTAFTTQDLIRRARSYADADWDLFTKHPHLLGAGTSPFGTLSPADRARIAAEIERNRAAVAQGIIALEALDRTDFRNFFRSPDAQGAAAKHVIEQLGTIVPLVYWHCFFERFLEHWKASAPRRADSPTVSQTSPVHSR